MLLSRLAEYTRNRLGKQPAMYEPRPVKWLVDLSEEGEFLGISMLSGGGGREKRPGKTDGPSTRNEILRNQSQAFVR